MSRIQNILDKAEREGAALRTSRLDVPTTATVPITIEIPTPGAPVPDLPATIVPGAAGSTHARGHASSSASTAADTLEHYTVRLNPLLIAGLSPKSLAAEQYRQLRTRLSHAEGTTALRTILITSPQKGEGKSITAANLALTMAQELQRRVVLVEADLRKPSLQQMFGLPSGPGLAEFLAGACDLREALKFLPSHNLTVMPAGSMPANPAELLGSPPCGGCSINCGRGSTA